MVEQTGEDIDWERCPPEIDDFPESVHSAVEIFTSLGNRIFPDVGYIGKDFTNLEMFYSLFAIEEIVERDWILEIILFLDAREIKENQRQIKAELNKAKRK
jgi:hypothetical protein|tara:strand:- start:760 stop:1062 length:303 start_codon:yes stop_codon:yes gene_type:complete